MENPFKKILQHDVPEALKQKVLDDVNVIKLSIDVADLFVVKYPNTVADLIAGGSCCSQNKKDKN